MDGLRKESKVTKGRNWLAGFLKGRAPAKGACDIPASLGWARGKWLAFRACKLVVALVLLVGAGSGLLFARLAVGPIALNNLAPQLESALSGRFGHAYEFGLGELTLVRNGFAPAFRTGALSIKESSGPVLLTAPQAEVTLDPWALLLGRVAPQRLDILDVEVHLTLRPDGSVVFPMPAQPGERPSGESQTPAPAAAAAQAEPEAAGAPLSAGSAQVSPLPASKPPRSLLVKRLGGAIRLAIDLLTDPASPAAAITGIGIKHGKLVIDDEATNQAIVFNGVDLGFEKGSSATRFKLSVEGPNGRWQAFGVASGTPSSERRLLLSVSNLSLDEILLAAGTRAIGVDFDMPLSARLGLRLSADRLLTEAAGDFELGSGYLRFDDPDDEPMLIDNISGSFHWDRASRRIMIERWGLSAAATHFMISGFVALPVLEGDPWPVTLVQDGPGVAGPERPGEKPVPIDRIALAARLYLAEKKLALDRFSFSGPQCGLALAGTFDWMNGPHLRLGASISPTPIEVVLRLWPSFLAPPVKSYLLARASEGIVQKGTIQIDFDAADLRAMRSQRAPPDSKTLVDFTISDGRLDFLPGVPPLQGIEGTGHITGRTADFSVSKAAIDLGNGRALALQEGGFHIANTDARPAVPAVIEAKVQGSVETVADLLSHEALRPYASLPLDSATLKGEVAGNLRLTMRLSSHMGSGDTAVNVNAAVTNFTAEKLVGNESLEAGSLNVVVDAAGLRADGEGRVFGVPAKVAIERAPGKPAEAMIGLTLDDETRARQGFASIEGISGPIAAKINATLGTGEKPKPRVELDLSATAIELPGISKSAGRPGKIAFSISASDTLTSLDPFTADAGPIQARGKIDIGKGFSVITASFPQVKFSPGDDMRLDATSAGEGLKMLVRGSAIDARPFLKSLIFSPPSAGGAPAGAENGTQAKEIELDVQAGSLGGYNKKAIAGAELHFTRRGRELKQFSFAGTFGKDPLSCNLTGGGAAPQLNIVSEDAGSLLSFLDLYRHMEGGQLASGMIIGADELTGVLVINDFVLRGEPGLRRLVLEGAPPIATEGTPPKIDTSAVAFNKLQARFQRDGSRLVVSEGTMHGDQIGLTVDGALDFARDNADLRGTFVPLYAFNNIFARIPVVGLILGGGSAEQGLIGVNFRISGQASAPTLTINPLSAVAPGILRQIMGIVDFDPMHPRQ